jgi:tetratricopeptide (TPR) repeat protein
MKHAPLLVLLAIVAACATPLEVGERRYREGDRRGALEVWRSVAPDDPEYAQVAARVSAVEEEFERLVGGYKQKAEAHENEERLAEAILEYRLALALQPGDKATLAHVQDLARELATRKAALRVEYEGDTERGDLNAARESLARLRTVDPFDPAYVIEERQRDAALAAERRSRRARIRTAQADEVEDLIEAGRAAFRDEQLEEALALWRQALLIDPDNERVQDYIARAERQLESLERLRAEPDGTSGR